jgi:hypothetical protein
MIEVRPAVAEDVAAMEEIGRVTRPEPVWPGHNSAPGD